MKTIGLTIALMLALTTAACDPKDHSKSATFAPVKQEQVVKAKPVAKLSVEARMDSLEARVGVLEKAGSKAKAKKYSPAPKYDPNFK